MARPPTPPEQRKILFNCKLPKDAIERLKIICFRRSVQAGKKLSEGVQVEEMTDDFPMPRKPTEAEIEEYISKYPPPKQAELRAIANLPIPKRGKQ